ncbi:carboxymuconolactone decarboxylase family protein [Cupriavidus sp. a3]|uniref:carboxymuconolactone decarboxylase family protein n=1 Tax=Cupriavidus sp. a3 TaxID=3242158 RepID=UPI003D9C553C
MRKLDENAPEAMKSFRALDHAAFADGALSVQQKQIIAVACATGACSSTTPPIR